MKHLKWLKNIVAFSILLGLNQSFACPELEAHMRKALDYDSTGNSTQRVTFNTVTPDESIKMTSTAREHVTTGNTVRINRDGEDVLVITGGLHTRAGLDNLIQNNPAVRDFLLDSAGNIKPGMIAVDPVTGVRQIKLPRAAFNKRGWRGARPSAAQRDGTDSSRIYYNEADQVVAKTFFPDDWDVDEIERAARVIKADTNSLTEKLEDGATWYHGRYRGIEIRVLVESNNDITTVYPIPGSASFD